MSRVTPAVLLLSLMGGVACNRTAPDEFPSTSALPIPKLPPPGDPPTPSTPDAARCLAPTPVAAPRPVESGPAPRCPADPEKAPHLLPLVRVAFPNASGISVEAELARSQHDTMRGLMFRRSMPEDHGMLFDLGAREDHEFWMHNTCIPLDLLYLDEDGFIVGIVENAPTLNDDSRGVGCPSRYVLEVNAGWSRRHGVKAGQSTTIPPDAR